MRPSDKLVRWECEAGYSGGDKHSSKESTKESIRGGGRWEKWVKGVSWHVR